MLTQLLYFVKSLQNKVFLLEFPYMKAKQLHDNKCPIAKVAMLLSDMWTILLIRDLLASPKRFSELLISLNGISSRTLTLKLHRLQEMNMLTHKETLYQLTTQGKKMNTIIKAMEQCGKNLPNKKQSQ